MKTMERLAGRRIMAGFHGTELNSDLRYLIDTIGVCGIILFSRNITGREQLKSLCGEADAYARSRGLPPLLIAVDQEGGGVARLKAPDFTEFAGPPAITDEADAAHFARITASELSEAGINMNMAPVMDVVPEGVDSAMSKRVFGSDPHRVARLGATVIHGLQEAGIMAVAKHFPGIGRSRVDSHIQRPDLFVSYESLAAFDLVPFRAAIAADVSGIMLSHVRYPEIDPRWPASLSAEIGAGLLRNQMGYNGVVFTDDLEMGAVANHHDMPEIARQVLGAGIDVALVCKTKARIEDLFESMCRHIASAPQAAESAEASVHRISTLQHRLDPLQRR